MFSGDNARQILWVISGESRNISCAKIATGDRARFGFSVSQWYSGKAKNDPVSLVCSCMCLQVYEAKEADSLLHHAVLLDLVSLWPCARQTSTISGLYRDDRTLAEVCHNHICY